MSPPSPVLGIGGEPDAHEGGLVDGMARRVAFHGNGGLESLFMGKAAGCDRLIDAVVVLIHVSDVGERLGVPHEEIVWRAY